jgi:hypothetical protein
MYVVDHLAARSVGNEYLKREKNNGHHFFADQISSKPGTSN